MKFGTKKRDAAPEADGGGLYLRNFKDGEVTIRVLEETDDWTVFREHYTADSRSFPCTGDRLTCPGCTSDDEKVNKSSRKYATYVKLANNDLVLPFRIPVSLAKQLFTRSEKNDGTITNRDYTVIRSGKGLDTTYDVDSEERYAVDVKALLADVTPIEDILKASFEEVWGEDWEPEAPAKSATKTATGRPRRKTTDEELDEQVAREAARKQRQEQDPPSEPAAQSESAGEADVIVDEDAIYDMTMSQLTDLASKAGVDVPEDAKRSQLIRLLLGTLEKV